MARHLAAAESAFLLCFWILISYFANVVFLKKEKRNFTP
jgi:hypothetical protein